MRPWLFLPACVGSDSVSVFSGSLAVTSSKPEMVMNLRPGVVGFDFVSGMCVSSDAPEQAFDLLAFAEGDDGLLPARGVADRAADAKVAAGLAAHGHGVDVLDADALRLVLLLEGLLDVVLRRRLGDPERVSPLRIEGVGALGDERADHDLGCGAGGHTGSSPPWSGPSRFSWPSCSAWPSCSSGTPRPPFGCPGRPKFS